MLLRRAAVLGILLLATPSVPEAVAEAPAAARDPAPDRGAPLPDGRRLLLDCEKQFLRLASIEGTLRVRSVLHEPRGGGIGPIEERRSDFVYARFDRVRFENVVPVPHSVIWNGETLWIWSPRENAAVEQPAEAVSALSRSLLSLQPGFGIDLLAPIPLDAYRARTERVTGGAEGENDVRVVLEPADEDRAPMELYVDRAKRMVTRIRVLSRPEGAPVSDVRLTKPVQAKEGIWFATQVEARQLLADGSTLEELRTFERLKFDAAVDERLFEFTLPEGATRVPVEAFAPKE